LVDRKARPAQPVIEQIEALEGQIADLDRRAETLERELIKDREVEAERRERVSASALRVGEADGALVSALPTLRSAQELSAAITRDAVSADTLAVAAQQAEAAHTTHSAELEAAQQTLAGAQARQSAAQAAREAIPHGEGVLDAYAALSEALGNLETRDAERGKAAELVAQIEAERAQIEADRARCDAELGQQRAARATLEGEQAAALAALDEVLAGAPDAASRKKALLAEHDEVQGALRTLEEARRDHDRLGALQAKITELEQGTSQQGLLHAQLLARRDEQQRDLEQTLALQKEREERRRAAELALVMVRHKHELRDGSPCPLCGSAEHPGSASGADDIAAQRIKLEAQLSAVETSLARDVAHIAQVRESLRDLDAELAEADSRLRAQRERREERATEQREVLGRYNGGRASQGLDPVQRFPQDNAAQQALLGQLQQKIGEQQRELEAHAADLAMLDQQRDALHEVQQKIGRLRDHEAGRELERLDERARNAGARVEEARQRASQLIEAVTSGCDALGGRLATLELLAEDARGIEALREGVELGSRRRASFVAASAGWSEASAQVLATGKEVAVLEERTRDAASRLELAVSQRDAAAQRLAADRERLVGMVGDVDPKAREQELRDALSAAQREQSEAQEAHHAAAQRVATQETLAREVATRLAQAQQRLIAEQEALTNQLHRLGMADAAAVRAVLLSAEERTSLESRDATLQAERAVRDRVLGEAQAAQAAHAAGRPEQEVAGAADVASAQEALTRLDARREGLAQEVGALEHELDEQDRARAKVSIFEVQLDELSKQRDVWKRISDLIGRKDGDRFKEFAQSLNLQSLLQRANARLRRFTPRYTLGTAREEDDYKMQWPTMSFVVIDSYQAHSERPVTTLSGGETFMVSLSLALALADMRRQAMPQETLLMDEGFGTLDQHTLSIVMNTLQQLHQDANQQIGLISHVEALRERIPYRVVVEPMGTGRSLIRMEQPDRHVAIAQRPELPDDFPY
jgi:DNA repair protein SbcC/Rad50